jgi:hypothetical protein
MQSLVSHWLLGGLGEEPMPPPADEPVKPPADEKDPPVEALWLEAAPPLPDPVAPPWPVGTAPPVPAIETKGLPVAQEAHDKATAGAMASARAKERVDRGMAPPRTAPLARPRR